MQCIRQAVRPAVQCAARCSANRTFPMPLVLASGSSARPFSTALTSMPFATQSPLSLLRARSSPLGVHSTPMLTTTTMSVLPTTANSLLSTRTFSSSASLGAPRNTYNPSHRRRKRRHGFLSRIKTRTGRMTLMRRRQKGRQNLSH